MRASLLRKRVVVSIIAGTCVAGTVRAGSLSPPAGPVAPTMKPLAEIEPRIAVNATNAPGTASALYQITQPGSYYLTGNVTGVSGKAGIEISAANVTLDLNGFTVQGVGGSLQGIRTISSQLNPTVRNGVVAGFGGNGIDFLFGGISQGGLIEQLRVLGNSGHGIVPCEYCVVRNCTAVSNMTNGINAPLEVTVEACVAGANGGVGIDVTYGIVSQCVAANNTGYGIHGNDGVTITHCTVRAGGGGISATNRCSVLFNTCSSCTGAPTAAGINCGTYNRIEGNHVSANSLGVNAPASGENVIVRNTCRGNGTNWMIGTGNAVAPIVSATTNTNAISGNTYAGSLGTTDPMANLTY